jgi:hypothetical protein
MSIGKIAAVWLTSLLLVGCATTMPTQENAAAVHVITTPRIPRGCVFIGGAMSNHSIEDLRGKAAGLGGNLALATMKPPRPPKLCAAPGGGYVPCDPGYHGSGGP